MLLYTAKTLVTMQQFAVLEGWMVTFNSLAFDYSTNVLHFVKRYRYIWRILFHDKIQ